MGNPAQNSTKRVVFMAETECSCEVGMTNAKRLVSDLVSVVEKHQPDPQELRYAFKKVREQTGLRVTKISKKLPRHLTAAEIYTFLKTAQKISAKHRLLAEMLLQTGLRISELANLDIRDISLSDNTLLVRNGKGGKDRTVPIGNSLLHAIWLYIGERRTGKIFVKKNHKPVASRTLQHWFQQIGERAFGETMGPHVARHTFGCWLRAKGFPLSDIQLYMGHEHQRTTEIYSKLSFTPEQKSRYLQLFP